MIKGPNIFPLVEGDRRKGRWVKVPIIVSDDFARAYGKPLHPLGRHILRGLADPHELYAPVLPPSADSSLAKAE
jgi:hypothetical protein